MERASRVLERFALAILLVGGLGMLISMFLGAGDVVGTQFFGWPLHGAKEITESTMVLIVFGALAYAQIRRAHIRVELVHSHMTPRVQAAMDVIADIAALIFFSILVWQCTIEAVLSWQIGEAADGLLRFPLYPARWILVAGTALLILRLVLDLIIDIRRIRSGEALDAPGIEPIVTEISGLNNDNGRQG
jgi:TRAP-type mannitol/chloroaromatic compound transport system permease small subunit